MLNSLFKKKTPIDKYMAHLDKIFQIKPEYFKEKSQIKGLPGVTTIVYKDIPEKGMITGVTYGLSLVKHADWQLGRPELIITVNSNEVSWAKVAGFLANNLRGECPFSYSNTIKFGNKVSNDSNMDAFLVFAPAILNKNDATNIDIGLDYRINISGLYPIYTAEAELIETIGLEKFWKHPDFNMYDINRKPITN